MRVGCSQRLPADSKSRRLYAQGPEETEKGCKDRNWALQCCILLSTASVTHPTFSSCVNLQHEYIEVEKNPCKWSREEGMESKGRCRQHLKKWGEMGKRIWPLMARTKSYPKSWKHTAANHNMPCPTHSPCKLLTHIEAKGEISDQRTVRQLRTLKTPQLLYLFYF